MSALLALCMSLLARERDKLCHVLVNPPFDSQGLEPPFLFPRRGVMHLDPSTGKRYRSSAARVTLVDIPFVRMRGWYEREFLRVPTSYSVLVRRMQGLAPDARRIPAVVLDKGRGTFRVGEVSVHLSPAEFAVMLILMERWKKGDSFDGWKETAPEIEKLHQIRDAPLRVSWINDFQEKSGSFDFDDARKAASRIRRKLRKRLGDPALISLLLPPFNRREAASYPAAKIRIKDW